MEKDIPYSEIRKRTSISPSHFSIFVNGKRGLGLRSFIELNDIVTKIEKGELRVRQWQSRPKLGKPRVGKFVKYNPQDYD